jgi:tetratricopeptide (TPR) repeat protein
VQLVDGASRRLVWSRQYEGDRSGYPQLLREAAEGLAHAIRPAASVSAKAVGDADLQVQRGRYYLNRWGALYRTDDARHALEAFEQALDLDPTRADAAAGAAILYTRKAQTGDPDARGKIESWARRALELDPRSSQAWTALSYAEKKWGQAGSRLALEYALKGAAVGPRDPLPHAQLGQILLDDSCLLALQGYGEAIRLDPLYFNAKVSAAHTLDFLGRTEESLKLIDEVLRLEPEAPLGLLNKARWTTAGRKEQDALLARLEPLARQGRIHASWLAFVRDIVTLERDDAEAGPALARARAVAGGGTPFPAWDKFVLGGVAGLANQGKPKPALEILTRLAQGGVVPPYDMLTQNPRIAPLASEAGAGEILEKSRSRYEGVLAVLEAARNRNELPRYLEQPLAKLRAETGAAAQPSSGS